MIEYKLVPIGDMNHAVTEGKPLLNSNEKTVNEEISLTDRKPISGGSDIKDYILKIGEPGVSGDLFIFFF